MPDAATNDGADLYTPPDGILWQVQTTFLSVGFAGLAAPVGETSIALGVFEDVQGGDVPQVRVETGEYFVVWPGDTPRVFRFGTEPMDDGGSDAGDDGRPNGLISNLGATSIQRALRSALVTTLPFSV